MGAVSRPPSPAPRSSAPPCTCTLHLLRSSFGNAFLISPPVSVFLPHTRFRFLSFYLADFRFPRAYTFSFSFSLSICSPGASSLHCNCPEHCIPALRPRLVPVCFTNCLQPLPCLRCIGPIQASHVPASGTRALYSSIPALVPRTPCLNSFIVLTPYTPTLSLPFVPYSCLLLIPGTHPWLRSLDSPKRVSRTCPLHVLRSRS